MKTCRRLFQFSHLYSDLRNKVLSCIFKTPTKFNFKAGSTAFNFQLLKKIKKKDTNQTSHQFYVLCQINKFKKRGGVTKYNSHQIEDTTSFENLKLPSLISEMSTPQIGATPEIPPLDFSNIDWVEVLSMDITFCVTIE